MLNHKYTSQLRRILRLNLHSRILIIGNSGAGKTTFARSMSKLAQIPYFSMDTYCWGSYQRNTPDIEKATGALRHISQRECWIIEGIFVELHELCSPRANQLILLDFDLETCLVNLHSRIQSELHISYTKTSSFNIHSLYAACQAYYSDNFPDARLYHFEFFKRFARNKTHLTSPNTVFLPRCDLYSSLAKS